MDLAEGLLLSSMDKLKSRSKRPVDQRKSINKSSALRVTGCWLLIFRKGLPFARRKSWTWISSGAPLLVGSSICAAL